MLKISKGNMKIGNIMNVSLAPVKACRGCETVCAKHCYALKAYKQYPATRAAWDDNLIMAQDFPELFFLAIGGHLAKYKGSHFRWHVAGDILDSGYLRRMFNLADEFPHIKFLAFTKQYQTVNNFPMDYKPANLTIVMSAWPAHPMENPYHLPVAYVLDKAKVEDRIPAEVFKCPGSCADCKFCWDAKAGEAVVFNQH
jgi:hypothetical protein